MEREALRKRIGLMSCRYSDHYHGCECDICRVEILLGEEAVLMIPKKSGIPVLLVCKGCSNKEKEGWMH